MQNLKPQSVIYLGMMTMVMLIAIAILLIWKSGIALRATGYPLVGEFQNIGGLLPGAEVRYRGYKVGKVLKINPQPQVIKVDFIVKNDIKIPKGSMLKVIFDGLIGERYIAVVPKVEEPEMVKAGDTLTGYATSGLADFVDVGTQSLEESRQILEAIRSVVASNEVKDSMKNTVLEVGNLIHAVNEMVSQLKQISGNGELQQSITDIMSNLSTMTMNLKSMSESLNHTVSNPDTLENINKTISNVEAVSQELKSLVQDPAIQNALRSSIEGSTHLIEGSGNFMKTVSSIETSYSADIMHDFKNQVSGYSLNTDIRLGTKFIRMGLSDSYNSTQAFNLQIGTKITPSLANRVGFFYTYPGFALDWNITDALMLTTDVYDLNQVKANITGRYQVYDGFGIQAGVLLKQDKSYQAGLFYSPPPAK